MDTGATDHVNSDSSILDTILNNQGNRSVLVGNGYAIPVTTSGHASLFNSYRPLHLNHVLITPNIIKNLISVCKFTRDNKYSVEFVTFGLL